MPVAPPLSAVWQVWHTAKSCLPFWASAASAPPANVSIAAVQSGSAKSFNFISSSPVQIGLEVGSFLRAAPNARARESGEGNDGKQGGKCVAKLPPHAIGRPGAGKACDCPAVHGLVHGVVKEKEAGEHEAIANGGDGVGAPLGLQAEGKRHRAKKGCDFNWPKQRPPAPIELLLNEKPERAVE